MQSDRHVRCNVNDSTSISSVVCSAYYEPLFIQNSFIHLRLNFNFNLAMFLVTIIETCYAFGVMFIVCELFQRINLAFDECNEMVDQLDWYLFPAKIQQMLPIIIHFTQQPCEIKCFGSAVCDRDTFKYVSTIIEPRRHVELLIIGQARPFNQSNLSFSGDQDGILLFHNASSNFPIKVSKTTDFVNIPNGQELAPFLFPPLFKHVFKLNNSTDH